MWKIHCQFFFMQEPSESNYYKFWAAFCSEGQTDYKFSEWKCEPQSGWLLSVTSAADQEAWLLSARLMLSSVWWLNIPAVAPLTSRTPDALCLRADRTGPARLPVSQPERCCWHSLVEALHFIRLMWRNCNSRLSNSIRAGCISINSKNKKTGWSKCWVKASILSMQ